ncbi:TolC family protein [Pseudocolwellia agarivorans]|uniref:TolC family protein n=1 Tax=Pseudocolwellia agarivorans TaxID=1911682 RepID=UPI003F8817D4
MNCTFRHGFIIFSSLFLFSCGNLSEIDKKIVDVTPPTNWQQASSALKVEDNWLAQFNNSQLNMLVEQALQANHQLKIQAYQVDISKQNVIVSGSQLWPELDLSVQSSRIKSTRPTTYSSDNELSLDLSYEVDIWGKLSAAEREDQYNYLAQKALFEQAKQQLVVDVVTSWLAVIEANKLLDLYQKQAANSRENLMIIEAGYQAGLNEALDVYLIRNELNTALSQVALQEVEKVKQVRVLERLMGKYPTGTLDVNAQLPEIKDDIPLGLPSELISRKPHLKSSWYQLLAKDAGLAYAHKQRFPGINLSASLSDSADDIGDLLSSSSLAWSLIGSISAPIFNAGRLEANEEIVRAELRQSEQTYLDALYGAFSDVENALSVEKSLRQRYETTLAAQENAMLAATLSFEQYQSGLVTYTTVLEAQARSFDAQANLINIQNQLIVNRINLHLSLGGDFTAVSAESKAE